MRILERVQAFLPLLTIDIFLFFLLVTATVTGLLYVNVAKR